MAKERPPQCQETVSRGPGRTMRRRCRRRATHVHEGGAWCYQHVPCMCDEGDDYGEPHPDCPHHKAKTT